MLYRWRTGAIAWLFHRVSGLALALYLTIHIWVTHHVVQGPESFNQIMARLSSPPFKLVELALLAAIVYHAFNGIRILVIDFVQGSKYHKPLFWGAIACCVVVYLAIGWPLIREVLTLFTGH
ncbi:MAG: succinate dehydrogenase, cytochrome b556 subunit [Candidatus Eisenbacteria sp.]|nr:succinate dehydrogenase, cytochrome b556 subunit [Candidatus Eisenbacteria bacterium]